MKIFHVPQQTELGDSNTALIKASRFETDEYVNEWIKNLNRDEEFALHRECASYEPSDDHIYEIIKQQGLSSIHVKNQIGLTAFEYLHKHPYADIEIEEQKLINRLVLELMGEVIA